MNYTTKEAADRCRVTVPTIRDWLRKGLIAGTRVGRKWLIPDGEIQRILQVTARLLA